MKSKKSLLFSCLFLLIAFTNANSQSRYFTRNGKVVFNATSPSSPEKIEASNDKATSILDVSSGQLEFALLMKAFIFEKALMEEHFNENYVESDKFPKASFKGAIKESRRSELYKRRNLQCQKFPGS